jgi:cold shock CspA family protein
MPATTTGTIKRITDKGFGFIAAADGTEHFFHPSACTGTPFNHSREISRAAALNRHDTQ